MAPEEFQRPITNGVCIADEVSVLEYPANGGTVIKTEQQADVHRTAGPGQTVGTVLRLPLEHPRAKAVPRRVWHL